MDLRLELCRDARRSAQRHLPSLLHSTPIMARTRPISATLFVGVILAPPSALADRGALSLDIGAGGTPSALAAPYAPASGQVQGTSFTTSLGLRYAFSNWLELSSNAYFEPPVTYFHNGVIVRSQNVDLLGTLKHRFYRYGFLVGGRFVTG